MRSRESRFAVSSSTSSRVAVEPGIASVIGEPTLAFLDRTARREVTRVVRHRSLARGSAFLLLSSVSSYALVRLLPPLPFLRRPASSIVSYGSLHGHAPLENLLLYALALAIAVCVAALLLRVGDAAPGGEARDWPRPAFVVALALLAAVAVNASWIDPAAVMTDTFHEGEMIAYGPAFRSGGLASALIIHGPGIDLAPHLLASSLHPGAPIATT